MIWHVVRLDFAGVPEARRAELEADLAGLDDLDVTGWVHVARDLEQPDVTTLVTVVDDLEALEAYRTDPGHLPVVDAIRDADVGLTRLDIEVPGTPADMPR